MNIRSDTINDLQWQDIVVGTRSPTVGSEMVPCFREDGEWDGGGGGRHWRTRVSMQEVIERDRRAPECHTWHWVVRGEPGLAGPNLSLPKLSPQRGITCQDLPTLLLLCAVSAV